MLPFKGKTPGPKCPSAGHSVGGVCNGCSASRSFWEGSTSSEAPGPPSFTHSARVHGQHFCISCSSFLFFTLHASSLDRILIKFNETKLQETITVSGQALSIETTPQVHF